eukprot:97404_1
MKQHYPTFVALHADIVIAYCRHILKQTHRIGIELSIFCSLLFAKVVEVNDGLLCGDAEWNNVCIIIERFAGIKMRTSCTNNTGDITHVNEVILKLWIKQKSKVL